MDRVAVKQLLTRLPEAGRAAGVTILTYHRVGGGSSDELDLPTAAFAAQLDVLAGHEVVALDDAVTRLESGDRRPCVVLTFDDGFADVHEHAWPLLRAHRMPFTVYVASGYVGGTMAWEGSTARGGGAPGVSWDQLAEWSASGLCTIGNHTHHHVRPERLTEAELDACSDAVQRELGVVPRHFAYPWGIRVPAAEPLLRRRFRSAVTGAVGRNLPGAQPLALARVPVRRTDPIGFFRRKLGRGLGPELAYDRVVRVGKAVGARA